MRRVLDISQNPSFAIPSWGEQEFRVVINDYSVTSDYTCLSTSQNCTYFNETKLVHYNANDTCTKKEFTNCNLDCPK